MIEPTRNTSDAQICPEKAQEAASLAQDLLIAFDALKASGGALAPNFRAFVVNASASFERLRSGRPLSRRERRQMESRAADMRVADNLRGSSFAIDPETVITGAGKLATCSHNPYEPDPTTEPGKAIAPLLTLDVMADTVAMKRTDYAELVRELHGLRAQVEDLTARAATAGVKAALAGTYSNADRANASGMIRRSAPQHLGGMSEGFLLAVVDTVAEALGLRRAGA